MLCDIFVGNTPESPSVVIAPASSSVKVFGTTWGCPTVAVTVNRTLLLQCSARGYPIPTYRWHSKLGYMSYAGRLRAQGDLLKLKELTISDSGQYTCTASNSDGIDRACVYVRVYGRAYVRELSQFSLSVTVVLLSQSQ